MAETPDPAGERDPAGPEPAEGAEHDALDVAEWVSELRRLYVEPTTRAEVQQEGAKALLRRKFHIGGPRRTAPPVEGEAEPEQLSPMKLSPAFVPGSPHHPTPGAVPPAPDTDPPHGVSEGTSIVPQTPEPEGESDLDRDLDVASTSAASEATEGAGASEGPSSAAWLLSYLEATGPTTSGGDRGAGDVLDQTPESVPDRGADLPVDLEGPAEATADETESVLEASLDTVGDQSVQRVPVWSSDPQPDATPLLGSDSELASPEVQPVWPALAGQAPDEVVYEPDPLADAMPPDPDTELEHLSDPGADLVPLDQFGAAAPPERLTEAEPELEVVDETTRDAQPEHEALAAVDGEPEPEPGVVDEGTPEAQPEAEPDVAVDGEPVAESGYQPDLAAQPEWLAEAEAEAEQEVVGETTPDAHPEPEPDVALDGEPGPESGHQPDLEGQQPEWPDETEREPTVVSQALPEDHAEPEAEAGAEAAAEVAVAVEVDSEQVEESEPATRSVQPGEAEHEPSVEEEPRPVGHVGRKSEPGVAAAVGAEPEPTVVDGAHLEDVLEPANLPVGSEPLVERDSPGPSGWLGHAVGGHEVLNGPLTEANAEPAAVGAGDPDPAPERVDETSEDHAEPEADVAVDPARGSVDLAVLAAQPERQREAELEPAVVDKAVPGAQPQPRPALALEVEPVPVAAREVEAEPENWPVPVYDTPPEQGPGPDPVHDPGSEAATGPEALTMAPLLGTEVSSESEPAVKPELMAGPEPELVLELELMAEGEPTTVWESVAEDEPGGDADSPYEPEREPEPEEELGLVVAVAEPDVEPVAGREPAVMDVVGSSLVTDAEPGPDLEQPPEAETEPAPEPEPPPLRWVRPPPEPPRERRSGELVAEPDGDDPADLAATAHTPGHEEAPVAPLGEPPGVEVPAATSHPVTVAWRGKDAMEYLELDGSSGGDPEDLIIVEPPSQLFAQSRRRRPEHPPEPDTTVDVTPDKPAEVPVQEAPSVRAPAEPQPAARPPSGSRRGGTGRAVLLLVVLLVILAALVWYFLLRGSDPASAVSSTRAGVATVAAAFNTAFNTATDPSDLTS